MIVKNEEKTIAKCLSSVKKYMDEIVVIDTGSTDKTKEIAKNFGARIYDFVWVNDFSAARNFAKTKATKQWILQLDADEYMDEGSIKLLIHSLRNIKDDGIVLPIHNLNDEGKVGIIHQNIRVFKNIGSLFYEGRIHEHLKHKHRDMTLKAVSGHIMHTGYQDRIVEEKSKRERNLELLLEEVKEHPQDAYRLNNLATNYILRKDFKQTIRYANDAFEYATDDGQRSRALLLEVESYWMQNEYKKALHILLEKESQLSVLKSDVLFTKAKLYYLNQEYEKAEKYCIQRIKQADSGNIVKHKTEDAYLLLAHTQIKLRDILSALKTFETLMDQNKMDLKLAQEYVSFISKWMSEEEILLQLDAYYSDQWMKWALCMLIRHSSGSHKYKPQGQLDMELVDELFLNGIKQYKTNIVQTLSQSKNSEAAAMVVFLLLENPDPVFEDQLESDLLKCIRNQQKLETEFDKEEYFALLKILIQHREYEKVSHLLGAYRSTTQTEGMRIIHLLEEYFLDEAALEYTQKYMERFPDDEEAKEMERYLTFVIEKNK